MLVETNKAEDAVISNLEETIEDLKSGQGLLEQLEAMKELTEETYAKQNATGKIKPLYAYKTQVEKLLSVIASEEAAGEEKAKMALMEEATAVVQANFASDKSLKKKALSNAVAVLKGAKSDSDPVKDAYMAFFALKKAEAAKIDEAAEIQEARASLITKLNTVAMTEKFYFNFDASGTPKMIA